MPGAPAQIAYLSSPRGQNRLSFEANKELQVTCSFSSLFGILTKKPHTRPAVKQVANANHQTARNPPSSPAASPTRSAMVSEIAAKIAVERFCAVMRRLPAAP